MSNRAIIPAPWAPRLLSVLRIVVGFLFMPHGAQKLLGFPAPFPMELAGGALVLIGLLTRPVAFVLVFLYLAAAGAGPWSVDRARHAP